MEEERIQQQQQQQQQQQLELRETLEGNLEQQTGIQSQFERKIQPQEFGQHFNNFSPTVRQNSGSPSAFRGLERDSSAARGVFERIRNSLVKGERFMVEPQQPTRPLTTTTKSLMTLTTSSRTTSRTTSTTTSTISTTTIATTEKSAKERPNERIIISSVIKDDEFIDLESESRLVSKINGKTSSEVGIKGQNEDLESREDVVKNLEDLISVISRLTQQPTEVTRTRPKLIETQEEILELKPAQKIKDSNENIDKQFSEDDLFLILKKYESLLSEELTPPKKAQEKFIETQRGKDHTNFVAVEEALTTLLGSDPDEDDKISPTFFEAVVNLDEFLREEEEMERQTVDKVSGLLEEAVQLASGVIDLRRKIEERLSLSQ